MDNEAEISAVNEEQSFASSFERFEHWLTNSFWFHYKWYFILAVFGLTLLILALVGAASHVEYDWKVVYAHYGQEQPDTCRELQSLLQKELPETGKNRRVDVEILDLAYGEGDPAEDGEYRLFGYMRDQDCQIFLMDEAFYTAFSALGYFKDGRVLAAYPGLYAATNDAPVKVLRADDPNYSDYSQEFLDEVNVEFAQEHEELMAAARSALDKLGK